MTIEELFGTLQQATVASWRKHLRTAKYAKHEALDEFYKELPEKVDALIEGYMGAHGKKITKFENILKSSNMNTLKYLQELKKVCKQGYDLLDENEELEGLLDDIVNLINSTLYKVKELAENKKYNNMKDLKDFINEALVNEAKKYKVDDYAHINDKRLNPMWLDDAEYGEEHKYEFLPNTPKIVKAAVNPVKIGKYWIAFDNVDDQMKTMEKLGYDPEDAGVFDEAYWDPEYNELLKILKADGCNC